MSYETLHPGQRVADKGDLYVAHHRLQGANRWGVNWRPGELDLDKPPTAQFGRACQRAKWRLGYTVANCEPFYGEQLNAYLLELDKPRADRLPLAFRIRRRSRLGKVNPYHEPVLPKTPWPFSSRSIGDLNGCPYQGTHTLGNWESDRAIDLNCAFGTPVLAIWDGVLNGPQGPIYSSDPHLMGLRLHLRRADGAESYYAHLSRIDHPEGTHVKRGQVLGLSGSAAGVNHLHIATTPMRPDDYLAVGGCE